MQHDVVNVHMFIKNKYMAETIRINTVYVIRHVGFKFTMEVFSLISRQPPVGISFENWFTNITQLN